MILSAANAYLGLFTGMTVSASIPAAVVSMGLFRMLRKASILENNLVQTAASAGESVTAGAIFTLPALLILGFWTEMNFLYVTLLCGLGGLLGVLVCFWLFARRAGKSFFAVSDFIAPLVPLGLGAGRIGNFINGELWGRVSDAPWAMIFPGWEAGPYPRHPSQLYEFALEGVVLFALCWWFSARKRPEGAVSGLFAAGYGTFRFVVEFFREPDAHLGFLTGGLTMGQLLSLPLALYGVFLLWRAYSRGPRQPAT
jgi:prolipoprotein diacylglyceryl transferase